MNIVKVGDKRFVNVNRMTHVKPSGKEDLEVHFAVGGGSALFTMTKLKGDEAGASLGWLERNGSAPTT